MTRVLLIVCYLIISFNAIANEGTVKELEEKYSNSTSDTVKIVILNELAKRYAAIDLKHADSLARIAHQLLETVNIPKEKVTNYNRLSFINSSLGKYDEAIIYSDKAIALSTKLGVDYILSESYDTRFSLYFQKGDNVNALSAAESSNVFALRANASDLIAKSYDNLGILKGIKGQHTEAIEYFMKALKYFEEDGDDEKIGISLMHLGHTFELAGNLDKASEYLIKSLQVNNKSGNKYNEGWALVNLGVVYSRRNQMDSALMFYQESLAIAEQINNHRLILTCLDNIGGKYTLKRDFEKANYYLHRAYAISESSGINSRTVYIIGNLAENYLLMGKYDSAKLFGEQQLQLALSSDLISEQKVAYFNLAQIYDSLGEYNKAYHSLLNYISVNDTIFNRQKSDQIEALRESYEAEKKENEIASLKTINESQKIKYRSYAAAAVLFLILGSLLYYMQRLNVKRNQLLLAKEQEMDQIKSRFFANISHEFRTPLTLILGPLDDMITKMDSPDIKRKLGIMQQNAGRLLVLINQLLDLSKIESGKLKLEISKSNIISIIKGVSLSFHSIAEQRNIELELRMHLDYFEMNYDKSKIETILINLLSNAFKFTPEFGKVTIHSNTIQIKEDRNFREYFRIIVEDNGRGIPESDVDLIFDRFYQTETNQLLQQEGSGIGLALVKELVELHDGNIVADSKPGSGTRIIVDLPTDLVVNEPEETLHQIDRSRASAIINEMPVGADKENVAADQPIILVIEDHSEVRSYIEETIHFKYQVISAKDGIDGIGMAIAKIPDLIISDVMMPMKDGYEVCRELKNNEKTSHIPIILLTAKSDTEAKIEGLQTQADDYITKPFVPRELLVRIDNLIALRNKLKEKYRKNGLLHPVDIVVNSIDEKFLKRLLEIVESNIGNEKFGVEQLSNELAMSRSQLHRKLTALLDQSANQFIRTYRLQRAHALLKKNSATASEIAYQVGFSSPSYFTKCFHEEFGYTPTEIHTHTSNANR